LNFSLSLIVNNRFDLAAKICYVAKVSATIEQPFTATDENGEEYIVSNNKLSVNKEKLMIHDCKIYHSESYTPDALFLEFTNDIIAANNKKKVKRLPTFNQKPFFPKKTEEEIQE